MESVFHGLGTSESRGFHVEETLLTPDDVRRLGSFLEERRRALTDRFEQWIGAPLSDDESYQRHQARTAEYVARGMEEDFRHYLRGELDLETRLSPDALAFLHDAGTRDRIAELLGFEHFLLHYPPMLRFVPPGAQASAVPPHQDCSYNAHLTDFCTLWIPLTDIDAQCGGVIVYEGSQVLPPLPHHAEGSWEQGVDVSPETYPPHHVEVSAGDGLFFPETLVHQSAQNTSDRIRYSLDLRLIRSPEHTTKSYYDPYTGQKTRRH